MFEDKTSQTNINPTDLNQGKDPVNSDKMSDHGASFPFKKVEPQERKLAGNKGAVEDILAGTEIEGEPVEKIEPEQPVAEEPSLRQTPSVPAMHGPTRPKRVFSESVPPALAPAVPTVPKPEIKRPGKIFIIVLVILVAAILGLAGVFAYQYFSKTGPGNVTNSNVNTNESLKELLNVLNSNANTANENQNTENTLRLRSGQAESTENIKTQETQEQEKEKPAYEVDTDNDGLTDEKEIELGTNPNQTDTDNDELNDFEEVEIYKTNPIKPDTDGDGYTDGNEVKHGYDPLRPGNARLGE